MEDEPRVYQLSRGSHRPPAGDAGPPAKKAGETRGRSIWGPLVHAGLEMVEE